MPSILILKGFHVKSQHQRFYFVLFCTSPIAQGQLVTSSKLFSVELVEVDAQLQRLLRVKELVLD